jgi:hypothetical protein
MAARRCVMAPPKRPVGRPLKYKPEWADTVIDMLKRGKSKAQICLHLEINNTTFNRYCENYEEFNAAYKDNLIFAEGFWHDRIEEAAIGHNGDANIRGMEAIMQNRFQWTRGVNLNAKVEDARATKETKADWEKMTDKDHAEMLKIIKRARERGKKKANKGD